MEVLSLTYLTVNTGQEVRRETFLGKSWLVANMRIIVPGVLPGSDGPLLYRPETVAKNVLAWNGMPITINHPEVQGKPVSARHPEVLDPIWLGMIFNTKYDEFLDTEGWFDELMTNQKNKTIYEALLRKLPMEVSVGVFTRKVKAPEGATWNVGDKQTPYDAEAQELGPDHVGVLTNATGACSLADGCGLNVNRAYLLPPLPQLETPEMPAPKKPELVTFITANCKAWADNKATLEKLDEPKLLDIKATIEAAKKWNNLTKNAEGDGNAEEQAKIDQFFDWLKTAPAELKTSVYEKLQVMLTGVPASEVAPEEPAETPADSNKPVSQSPATNKNKVTPVAALNRRLTEKEARELLPLDWVQNMDAAKEVVTNERNQLIEALTANLEDGEKKEKRTKTLQGMTLDQLKDLAEDIPSTNKNGKGGGRTPLFFPQSGGRPVINKTKEKVEDPDDDDDDDGEEEETPKKKPTGNKAKGDNPDVAAPPEMEWTPLTNGKAR